MATTKKASSAGKTVKTAMKSVGKTTKKLVSEAGKALKPVTKVFEKDKKGRKSTGKRSTAKR